MASGRMGIRGYEVAPLRRNSPKNHQREAPPNPKKSDEPQPFLGPLSRPLIMERDVLAAASPTGWPAAPQNTTASHSETLCINLV
jgi:hypothetical protein